MSQQSRCGAQELKDDGRDQRNSRRRNMHIPRQKEVHGWTGPKWAGPTRVTQPFPKPLTSTTSVKKPITSKPHSDDFLNIICPMRFGYVPGSPRGQNESYRQGCYSHNTKLVLYNLMLLTPQTHQRHSHYTYQ